MRVNLHTYWAHWARSPALRLVLLTDWGIHWSVLGVLRQFYSFREGAIATKEKAGAYALTCLPVERHLVIWEALRIRTDGWSPSYRSRPARAADAICLLNYIIQRY